MTKTIAEPARQTPVAQEVDVLVAGGGIAGACAAIAAARLGAKVLLVERYGYLGGIVSAWPVPLLFQYGSEKQPLTGGIGKEIVERCQRIGSWSPGNGWHSGLLDTETLKLVLMDMLGEAGVQLLLHSFIAGAVKEGALLKGLVVDNKSGRQAVLGRVTVDATGDADVAAWAEAAFQTPADEDDGTSSGNRRTGVSFGVEFSGIDRRDWDWFRAHCKERHAALLEEFKKIGGVDQFGLTGDASGVFGLRGDPCDVHDLSRLELESSRQVLRCLEFLRAKAPGYRNIRVSRIAPQFGVRESRRIVAEYRLTRADCEAGTEFPDVVCRFNYNHRFIMGVPYRCLVPRAMDGLLIGSRSFDLERSIFGCTRLIGTTFGLGHAAGSAAALCARDGIQPRHLPPEPLRRALLAQGAYLDRYDPQQTAAAVSED